MILHKKIPVLFLLSVLLLILYSSYHYWSILSEPPQSVHRWRQADCASLTMNYYQHGMHFFQPEVHNITADEGKTGYSCPGEVPILYYFTALLYKIAGPDDAILRGVNLLLFTLGLFHLLLLYRMLLKDDWFWPVMIPMFFATSPLLAYYANNFLSDIAALSCSWMAAFYLFSYYQNKKLSSFCFAFFLMLLAACLKITALLLPLALIALFFLERIKPFELEKSFLNPKLQLFLFGVLVFVIICWVGFAKWYNTKHASTYFSTMIWPLWTMSAKTISSILHQIRHIWLIVYLSIPAWICFILSLIVPLIYFRRTHKILLLLTGLLVLGVVSFVLLEFMFFRDHDYYAINLFILPIFSFAACIYLLKKHWPQLYSSVLLKLLFTAVIIFSALQSRDMLKRRYSDEMSGKKMQQDYYEIKPWLMKAGIKTDDRVIVLPGSDHSPLYLINQPGWTDFFEWVNIPDSGFYYNRDSAGINRSLRNGAKFLLVYGTDELFSREYLAPFTNHLAGIYKNIWIFDLYNGDTNFSWKSTRLKESFYCDLETLTTDKQYFTDSLGMMEFGNAMSRSSLEALSGKYSLKLGANNPYGLTTKILDVRAGERFRISVNRKSAQSPPVAIVASAEDANVFYHTDNTVSPAADNWVLHTSQVVIPFRMDRQDMLIYIYCPDTSTIFFDDLRIARYYSYLEGLNPGFWVKVPPEFGNLKKE